MDFGRIIGEAIIAGTDESRDTAIARASLKMAVMRDCVCRRCGSILDQSRAVLIESLLGGRFLTCGPCHDEVVALHGDNWSAVCEKNGLTISDGRTLFGEE